MNVPAEGHEGWTVEELQAINAAEPVGPAPTPLRERAQLLLKLGFTLDRAAELLHVGRDELLRAVPRVHARVLLPPSAVYTLSPAQRLRLGDWT